MSGRHVEITYQQIGGLHRWVATDLQSLHGLFVRVSRTFLADQAEFLVGNGRYRFDALRASSGVTGNFAADKPVSGVTHGLAVERFRCTGIGQESRPHVRFSLAVRTRC
jgi:hypothetical protein